MPVSLLRRKAFNGRQKVSRKGRSDVNIPSGVSPEAVERFNASVAALQSYPLRASIIFVTCDRPKELDRCWTALVPTIPEGIEIVWVDNGSDAEIVRGACGRLTAWGGPFKLIANKGNLGIARARNQGMRIAEGRLLIHLDSDIIVPAGWIDEIEKLCSVQQIACGGLSCLAEDIPISVFYSVPMRVVYGNIAACFGMKREIFDELGYLCEEYGPYGEEDADWGVRCVNAGYLNAYSVILRCEHLGLDTNIYTDEFKRVNFKERRRQLEINCRKYAEGGESVNRGWYI